MQQGSAKKILSNLLKVAISVGGLAYIFWKVPFAEVCGHWTAQALPWILLILFCTVFSMAIQANRWRGLLLEEGKKIKFRTFYAYIALGYFFNNLLPSGFGGDAVKTIAFGKRFGNIANSVAAVAISRVMGLLAMFLCFFATLPFVVARYDIPTIYTGAVSAVALVSVLVIVGGLFSDKIKLPAKLTKLGVHSNIPNLREIVIPEGVRKIPFGCFENDSNLEKVEIKGNLTEIDAMAFDCCSSLKNLKLPDSITSIGAVAFQGCTSLNEITLPKNLKCVGEYAFAFCGKLTITVPEEMQLEKWDNAFVEPETESVQPDQKLTVRVKKGSWADLHFEEVFTARAVKEYF